MSTLPGVGHQANDPSHQTNDDTLSVKRRPRRHGQGSKRSRDAASNPPTEFRISLSVVAGVPLVVCEGHLGPDCVRDCSTTFAGAVRLRPRWIIADLSRAIVDEESVLVLGLMRRFAGRHGIKLALAAVPPRGLDVLRTAEVATLYDVHATVSLALATATAQAHRSFPRS
jgi:hypothetical protein